MQSESKVSCPAGDTSQGDSESSALTYNITIHLHLLYLGKIKLFLRS